MQQSCTTSTIDSSLFFFSFFLFGTLIVVQLCVAVVCAAETKAAILTSQQCGHVRLSTFTKMAKGFRLPGTSSALSSSRPPPTLCLCVVMVSAIVATSDPVESSHESSRLRVISSSVRNPRQYSQTVTQSRAKFPPHAQQGANNDLTIFHGYKP